jgi:hypothetical protein
MTTSGTNEAIDFSSKLGYVSGLQNVSIEKKKILSDVELLEGNVAYGLPVLLLLFYASEL